MAAGLEVAEERSLGPLRRRLEHPAAQALGSAGRPQPLVVDVHLAAGEVDWRLAEAVCAMQPCGAGWLESVVAVHGATVLEVAGEGEVPRLRIAAGGGMALTALPRRAAWSVEALQVGATIDFAAIPVVRDRRGYRCLELEILDAHPAALLARQTSAPARVRI
jgi:single-stranded DNA-specific DHH superfamily exonuclease